MRTNPLSILKAIGIILVVIAHSCAPMYVSRFSYLICVSLFFMASGYCFKPDYLNQGLTFVKRRFSALYVPFVKWSLLLLVLNPLWFWTGILNEHYGNAAGGVTHPLSWQQWQQSLWSIVSNMSGYDQFLAGPYWFFRGLLLASLLFFGGFLLLDSLRALKGRYSLVATLIGIAALLLALWQSVSGLRITGVAQGGYRELMGVFFLSAGFLYRRLELWQESPQNTIECSFDHYGLLPRLAVAVRWCSQMPLLTMPVFAVVLGLLVYFPHPSMSSHISDPAKVVWLALSGVVGFSFVYNLSHYLYRLKYVREGLCYIGNRTLYIFGWHILAFKVASMLKVALFSLPWLSVGCHPVIREGGEGWYWLIYTLFGLALPLGLLYVVRYCQKRYTLSTYLRWVAVGAGIVWLGLVIAFRFLRKWTRFLLVHLWHGIYAFCTTFVDTVKAGADVNSDPVRSEDDDDDDDNDDEDDNDNDDDNDDDASTSSATGDDDDSTSH